MIAPIISRLVDIALFRGGPERLPSSKFLLGLCLTFWFTERIIFAQLGASTSENSFIAELLIQLLIMVFIVAFFHTMLTIFNLKSRFLQTITAYFGAESLIDLMVFLMFMAGEKTLFGALLAHINLGWCVALLGFLIHRAFSISKVEGFIHGILVYMFILLIISSGVS